MIEEYYKPIARGAKIPLNNPYAFSVSMPTVQDVIDYEEETIESKEVFKSAYPRIVFHPYIVKVLELASVELDLNGKYLFLLPSLDSGKRVAKLSRTEPEFHKFNNYTIASLDINSIDDINRYYSIMKHCGYMVFDREAEDLLKSLEVKTQEFHEEVIRDNSENIIKDVLKAGYKTDDILISNCGMNAIYSGFESLRSRQEKEGRKLFIQYGWAYSDTIQIFKKCAHEVIVIEDVSNTRELEEILVSRGSEVAAVYLETISNPLLEVPDIPKVHDLSKIYNFFVLVDNTFATPWCVHINPYCDLIFESLTKFASGQGDIMAGAVVRPKDSRLDSKVMKDIRTYIIPLYERVQDRLAYSIRGYRDRVLKINSNSKYLVEYFKDKKYIDSIFSVDNPKYVDNWNKIKSQDNSFCGVISLVFKGGLKDFYDYLHLPKGPSLGSEFPLVMPYTMLAHYFDIKSKEGAAMLNRVGLSDKLLRFSVSIDDPILTINAIENVFN